MRDPRRLPCAEPARGAQRPRPCFPGLLQAPQRRSLGARWPLCLRTLSPHPSATPPGSAGAHPPRDVGAPQRRPPGLAALPASVPPATPPWSSSSATRGLGHLLWLSNRDPLLPSLGGSPRPDAPAAPEPPGIPSLSLLATTSSRDVPPTHPTPPHRPQDAASPPQAP